jgi:hypothetical protein
MERKMQQLELFTKKILPTDNYSTKKVILKNKLSVIEYEEKTTDNGEEVYALKLTIKEMHKEVGKALINMLSDFLKNPFSYIQIDNEETN